MSLWHRKSRWERAIEPVTNVDARSLVKSGITAAASAVTITAASAALSSWRRKEQS